jgi:hypothetical protein
MTDILATNINLVAKATIELMKVSLTEADITLMEQDETGNTAVRYGKRFTKLAITGKRP